MIGFISEHSNPPLTYYIPTMVVIFPLFLKGAESFLLFLLMRTWFTQTSAHSYWPYSLTESSPSREAELALLSH